MEMWGTEKIIIIFSCKHSKEGRKVEKNFILDLFYRILYALLLAHTRHNFLTTAFDFHLICFNTTTHVDASFL